MAKVVINRENFPSNSIINKVEKKSLEKVVSGEVYRRKENRTVKVLKSIWDYLLQDILIPAGKSTLSDLVSNAIEMALYGEPASKRKSGNRTQISYSSFSREREPRFFEREERKPYGYRQRFDDVLLSDGAEAAQVLSDLSSALENYSQVTVADLYDLVGIKSEWTDNKYGWTSLATAQVVRVREGYLLDLPRPVEL